MKKITLIVITCLLPFLALSCASQGEDLLARDHTRMSDDELLKYYYQIEDGIAKCERPSSGASIGFGTGVGVGRRSALGVGVSKGVGGCNSDQLRERRIDVRMALKKRGINP